MLGSGQIKVNFFICIWTLLFVFELYCVELRFIVCQKTTPITIVTAILDQTFHLKYNNLLIMNRKSNVFRYCLTKTKESKV